MLGFALRLAGFLGNRTLFGGALGFLLVDDGLRFAAAGGIGDFLLALFFSLPSGFFLSGQTFFGFFALGLFAAFFALFGFDALLLALACQHQVALFGLLGTCFFARFMALPIVDARFFGGQFVALCQGRYRFDGAVFVRERGGGAAAVGVFRLLCRGCLGIGGLRAAGRGENVGLFGFGRGFGHHRRFFFL